ncbi:MAG: membrane protein insertase YidC [Candidatus Acididesulfobacter diazotrophicus]|uniref:Membrane protein insertase YidC n=1 Tax=Candidatus Acididesulfobacter diazotrophicus TaxID=2597226 RepID=A0A519BQ74_9DELT|nr:MAG: membrane protein insertase YidC [Candidatus Acididesulfobacter diazotrophicus]
MEKRVLIAVILSIALVVMWGYFMPHPAQTPTQTNVKTPLKVKNANPSKKINLSKSDNININSNSNTVNSIKNKKNSNTNIPQKKLVFSNKLLKAGFYIPAGSIYSLRLKKYYYSPTNINDKVNLENTSKINQIINFQPSSRFSSIAFIGKKISKDSLKFIYKINNKILLTKEYKFSKNSNNNKRYLIKLIISAKNISKLPVLFSGDLNLSAGLNPNIKGKINYLNYSSIIDINNKTITPSPTGIKSVKYTGNISFAGFNSKYFLFSVINPGNNVIYNQHNNIIIYKFHKKLLIASGQSKQFMYNIYAGPKKLSLLNPAGHNIASTLSYGFFSFLSIPLLHILEFFYKFVHNYGLAIILLVLCIRIVFYPLTYTGFKSMKQMQKLTPKINELREKYKDNKADLNKRIMELYKESKVNPLGGCLPMILQIPVFYGLYTTLGTSIQLRNAPLILWIHNLAAPDPYYILPILMGLSMLISQKMNPMVGDPAQAKIMLILPVVFTFIFINFPAGLLLYWTVNNILTIAQQYIINKKFA